MLRDSFEGFGGFGNKLLWDEFLFGGAINQLSWGCFSLRLIWFRLSSDKLFI